MSRKRPRWWKKLKRNFEYYLIRGLINIVARIPRHTGLWLAAQFGKLAFLILRKDRIQTLENLTIVFGSEKSAAEIRKMGQQCFIHLAKNAVDVVRFPQLSSADFERLVSHDDLTPMDHAWKHGQGVIALTGHIGNWEMMAAWFALQGYPVSVVGRRLFDDRLNDMLVAARESKGLKNIDRKNPRAIWRVLRQGEILGILIDQDTKVENVVVDFFGRPARTPVGIAQMAIRSGAITVPLAIHRQPDETYHICFEKTIYPPAETENMAEAVHDLTQQFSHAIENLIRRDPVQWVWMHRRWRNNLKNENER